MDTTIDMQIMRHLNLFEKVTRIRTNFCFRYNETIFYCVPRPLIARALGEKARNIRRLSEILGRRIRVIPMPEGIEYAKQFVQNIVDPITFKDLSINEGEIVLNASSQNKAALIGRNKRRLLEMQKIIKDFFGKEFRIQ
ncbi:MAG: hypothetical protein AABW63_01330 [Nanoarchaeota archaeon]|mgnify:FL=1